MGHEEKLYGNPLIFCRRLNDCCYGWHRFDISCSSPLSKGMVSTVERNRKQKNANAPPSLSMSVLQKNSQICRRIQTQSLL